VQPGVNPHTAQTPEG